MATSELTFAIRAKNEAEAALKSVSNDLEKVKASAEKSHGMLGSFGSALGGVAKIASGIVIAEGFMKLPGLLMGASKAAADEEAAMARLHQTFRNYANMVGASEGTFEALNGLLDQRIGIGQKLAFTDDQVRDSFNALLTATDDSTEATKRQTVAFDLARGANIPLEQATRMLGKMTAENVEVFKKMGITIGENATEADALAAVQARFGGQAEAYAKSTAGQFAQTSIRMGELKEQIGMQLLPVMTKIGTVLVEEVIPKLEQFANYFQTNISPKIKAFWEQDAKPTLEAMRRYIQEVVMPAVQENFAKFQVYYETDIKPALANIKAGIAEVVAYLREHWGQIEGIVIPIFQAIQLAFENLVLAIGIGIDIIGGDWDEMREKMAKVFENDTNAWKLLFDAWVKGMVLQAEVIEDAFGGIAAGIGAGVEAAIRGIIGLVNKAIEAYNRLPLAPNISTISTGGGSSPAPTGSILNPDRLPGSPSAQSVGGGLFGADVAPLMGVASSGITPGTWTDASGNRHHYYTSDPASLIHEQYLGGGQYKWQLASNERPLLPGESPTGRGVNYGFGYSAANPAPQVAVTISGNVYGVDDLMYQMDRALKRAGQAGLVR